MELRREGKVQLREEVRFKAKQNKASKKDKARLLDTKNMYF